ncbi:response regulator [Pseudoalteromonas luteoviolacea B = ATCC 29581]|nr:response regulator [Pseudoalteromonas luteoviolacea B = ATCC 29581]
MKKILLVDDEESILKALSRILRPYYEVTTFSDSQAAVESLKNVQYNLIISDIRMPNIDGFELLRQAKEIQPVLGRMLISGYADLEDCEEAIDTELAAVVVSKPWDNFELLNVIKLVLKYADLNAELTRLKG